ncbi:hypothetical protein BC833DRAFT_582525 [Globomyces pollinis-pini]|nr:hypothetical protein BC833DRAFT_582525 [Globomyces pollinis-pini]
MGGTNYLPALGAQAIVKNSVLSDPTTDSKHDLHEVYFEWNDSIERIMLTMDTTSAELEYTLFSLCGISPSIAKSKGLVISIWEKDNQIIGPLDPNTAQNAYKIVLNENINSDSQTAIYQELRDLSSSLAAMDIDKLQFDGTTYRCSNFEPKQHPRYKFSKSVKEQLKTPTFNNWEWSENELVSLVFEMYNSLNLLDKFQIEPDTLYSFISKVKEHYQNNPFHNFQHGFCVTQMAYSIIHVSGIKDVLTDLEKLTLLTACLGHDTDHPGYNNAYQINAKTDLAIIYNDQAPLENHHCAMLFAILGLDHCNILKNLEVTQFSIVRKGIIRCIMATDMAKHGELLSAFNKLIPQFSFEDAEHRIQLLSTVVKCADVSTEVRPPAVADVWVNRLLEEFFCQSDREKFEGLPTLPFMDRDKVTKPGAQIGFLSFVVVPLYESLGKLYPCIDADLIQPIKRSLDYYKSLDKK